MPMNNPSAVSGAGNAGGAAIYSKTGKRLVVWGDSTAEQNNPIASGYQVLGNAWVQKSLYAAGNPLDVVAVVGNSGFRTDQIIANFAAQVTANTPDFVMLPAGTNDLIQGYGNAAALTGIARMAALVESIGAVPILCALTPGDTWALPANRELWRAHNASLLALAVERNMLLFDASASFATTAGQPDAIAGTNDGIHPNNLACEYIAAAQGGAFFKRWARRALFNPAIAAANLVTNPYFTGTGGNKQSGVTGVVPDGCTATVVNPGAVSSVVARTDGGPGNWWQMELTMNAGTGSIMYLATASMATAGLAVGDTFRAVVDVEVDAGSTNLQFIQFIASFTGGNPSSAASNIDATNNGIAIVAGQKKKQQLRIPEKAIPAGTTVVSLYVYISPQAALQGRCTVRIGAGSAGKV